MPLAAGLAQPHRAQHQAVKRTRAEAPNCARLVPRLSSFPPMILQPPLQVLRLFISPGHNFFGHHGKPPGKHPTLEVPSVRCVSGLGIEGDRFFDYKDRYKGQITFFSREVYDQLCGQLNVHDKSPGVFRRNVFCAGVDLNTLVGKDFLLQGIQFRGRQECSPCYWMDEAFGPGAEAFLKGRGGLRAEILSAGELRSAVEPA
jgi:MOSC domain-containing protein YiiM